jgi:hypothetical protein
MVLMSFRSVNLTVQGSKNAKGEEEKHEEDAEVAGSGKANGEEKAVDELAVPQDEKQEDAKDGE